MCLVCKISHEERESLLQQQPSHWVGYIHLYFPFTFIHLTKRRFASTKTHTHLLIPHLLLPHYIIFTSLYILSSFSSLYSLFILFSLTHGHSSFNLSFAFGRPGGTWITTSWIALRLQQVNQNLKCKTHTRAKHVRTYVTLLGICISFIYTHRYIYINIYLCVYNTMGTMYFSKLKYTNIIFTGRNINKVCQN